MSNRKIESMGRNWLSHIIDKNPLLQAYVDSNDKTPLWDGEIHLLRAPSEKKQDIIGRVPIQVKATAQNKPMEYYRMDISDLCTYAKNGGLVLFMVCLETNLTLKKVCLNALTPFKIEKYVKKAKRRAPSTKSLNVDLYELDEKQLYSTLLNFFENSQREQSFVGKSKPSIKTIEKTHKMKVYYSGNSITDVFDYQKENDLTVFIEDKETGIEIPLEETVKLENIIMRMPDLSVTIGNNYSFNKITKECKPNNNAELHIGVGLKIKLNIEKGKLHLNYSRPNSLAKAIQGTAALLELTATGFMYLNDSKIIFDEKNLQSLKESDLEGELIILNRISEFLKAMNVGKDVDLSMLDDESQRNMDMLIRGVINREKIRLNFSEATLLRVKVANINFLTLYFPEEDNEGTLVDIFKEIPWCKAGEDIDNSEWSSVFECLEVEDWIKVDNCNFEAVLTSYNRIIDSAFAFSGVGDTIIRMISAADEAEATDRKELLIQCASQLSDLNIKHGGESAKDLINSLQIKTRVEGLSPDDIEKLSLILSENRNDFEICFGASVVLKSKQQADLYWNKLTENLKEKYKKYPIYTLYREL